jgi:CRP-like cAMP-binding protein
MRDTRVDILKKVPLFRALGKRELQKLATAGQELEFLAGSMIVQESSIGSDFYLLESGKARVIQDDEVVRELDAGDFFGEVAILNDSPRTASVIAETRVWVFRIGRQAFIDLLDTNGVIARKVLIEYAKRTRPAETRTT